MFKVVWRQNSFNPSAIKNFLQVREFHHQSKLIALIRTLQKEIHQNWTKWRLKADKWNGWLMNAGADTISLDKSTNKPNRKYNTTDSCNNRESIMMDPRPSTGCHHSWCAVKWGESWLQSCRECQGWSGHRTPSILYTYTTTNNNTTLYYKKVAKVRFVTRCHPTLDNLETAQRQDDNWGVMSHPRQFVWLDD